MSIATSCLRESSNVIEMWCRIKTGELIKVHVPPGSSLMQAIRDCDLPIEAACGGSLACGTCHISVDPDWLGMLPAPSRDELGMLDCLANTAQTSRLSCQIRPTEDLAGLVFEVIE